MRPAESKNSVRARPPEALDGIPAPIYSIAHTPSMDEYPISYATLTTWEHLKARLEESFDTETFLLFWLLTNKMTLD